MCRLITRPTIAGDEVTQVCVCVSVSVCGVCMWSVCVWKDGETQHE